MWGPGEVDPNGNPRYADAYDLFNNEWGNDNDYLAAEPEEGTRFRPIVIDDAPEEELEQMDVALSDSDQEVELSSSAEVPPPARQSFVDDAGFAVGLGGDQFDLAREPRHREYVIGSLNREWGGRGFEIRPTKFGHGLFYAGPEIRSGTRLGEYTGHAVPSVDADKLHEQAYDMVVDAGEIAVVGNIQQEGRFNPFAFANDPGDFGEANIKLVPEEGGRVGVYATRNITAGRKGHGSELSLKYGKRYWGGDEPPREGVPMGRRKQRKI